MFRTEIHPQPSDLKINLSHKILSMGSCFSEHIGKKLAFYKFMALINPFGTIYNPLSLFRLIEFSLTDKKPEAWSYLHHQGIFRNYYFHSDISAVNEEDFHQKIKNTFNEVKVFASKADVLVFTFGSAIGYKLKNNNETVANCHKVPSREFEKYMLTPDAIAEGFKGIYRILKQVNPNIRFILTVSPDRHLKETLELNSVSKATLRLATEDLQNTLEGVSYFPSYELMIDDLRDYRFYKEDMVHPTEQAVDYIWNKFSETHIDKKTLGFIAEWEKIMKSLQHKPFNPGTEEHHLFIKKTKEKLETFKNLVDISEEMKVLEKQLELR